MEPEALLPCHNIIISGPVTNQDLEQSTILKHHWRQRYIEGAEQERAGFSMRAAKRNLKYQAKTT